MGHPTRAHHGHRYVTRQEGVGRGPTIRCRSSRARGYRGEARRLSSVGTIKVLVSRAGRRNNGRQAQASGRQNVNNNNGIRHLILTTRVRQATHGTRRHRLDFVLPKVNGRATVVRHRRRRMNSTRARNRGLDEEGPIRRRRLNKGRNNSPSHRHRRNCRVMRCVIVFHLRVLVFPLVIRGWSFSISGPELLRFFYAFTT